MLHRPLSTRAPRPDGYGRPPTTQVSASDIIASGLQCVMTVARFIAGTPGIVRPAGLISRVSGKQAIKPAGTVR